MRIAFATTWYGPNIGGGAEAECRGLVHAIKRCTNSIQIEVLTTCLKEFAADWNTNHYDPGVYLDDGITVRRFPALPHDRTDFHPLNYYRLMPPVIHDLMPPAGPKSPLTPQEENFYLQNMVVSPDLLQFIETHREQYDLFVFIPYMFATSVLGSQRAGGKYVVIPCLHKERYAFMEIYRDMLRKAAGVFFHVPAEMRFANEIYQIPASRQFLIGEKVETNTKAGIAARFREKFGIVGPYFLYAGRKIEGKNLPELVRYFRQSRFHHQNEDRPKLVIIGSGDLSYQDLHQDGILDLGFVSAQDKLDAMAGASALIQPSLNESFSIVMMEAWLQGAPVIVDARCDVTREHVEKSQGGFSYLDPEEFQAAMIQCLDADARSLLGSNGRKYVIENYSESVVTSKVLSAFESITGKSAGRGVAHPA